MSNRPATRASACLTLVVVRLVGGPHDGKEVLAARGTLQIALPGDLEHVTRTGSDAGLCRTIYVRDSTKADSATFEGWEGGSA